MKVMVAIGTRPDAIKMAPVIAELQKCPDVDLRICLSGQHRTMLDDVLRVFSLKPDFDLEVMVEGQDLAALTSRILKGMADLLSRLRPDTVLLHGDTTTAMATALASFYAKVPVAHVEAGLRSHDLRQPWPEEMNRLSITRLASIHFAPTRLAYDNLMAEGIDPARVEITGNTVIDALSRICGALDQDNDLSGRLEREFSHIDPRRPLVLFTSHRRENIGMALNEICEAALELSSTRGCQIVFPTHLNGEVRNRIEALIGNRTDIHLPSHLDYPSFVYLMRKVNLIVTDSGGIQEEAPFLGKPVIVTRHVTERREGIDAGVTRLVAPSRQSIVEAASAVLDAEGGAPGLPYLPHLYGDGHAASRIVERLLRDR